MTKKTSYFILSIALILIFTELVLRLGLGFGDAVLMMEDEHYEYIAQPNQQRERFGNTIIYNQYSMRSAAVDTAAIKILGFGDSIINGGTMIDHDSLATTLLTDWFTEFYRTKVQVLNISSGGWGPDNAYAYLKEHGNFDAQAILLVVNSKDLTDNMAFEKRVGIDARYPKEQHLFAIEEAFTRYLMPKYSNRLGFLEIDFLDELHLKEPHSDSVNSGFEDFIAYSKTRSMPLLVVLHASLNELKAGSYNSKGEQIIELFSKHQIPLIQDLHHGLSPDHIWDDIHLNASGQKFLANLVFDHRQHFELD